MCLSNGKYERQVASLFSKQLHDFGMINDEKQRVFMGGIGMKHVMRALIILLIAGVVAGGLYALSTTAFAQSLAPERGGHHHHDEERFASRDGNGLLESGMTGQDDGDNDFRQGTAFDGDGAFGDDDVSRRDRHGRDEGFSLTEVLAGAGGHLLLLGLIVGIVVMLRRGLRLIQG
jgi:hypothetical protein